MPEKRLLGLHQYKAPPILARQTVLRAPQPQSSGAASGGSSEDDYERIEGVEESAFLGESMPVPSDGDEGPLPGANADAAALSQARAGGEEVIIAAALNRAEEETSKKKLPSVTEVLPQIPVKVQEALDDLFRAKWTRVVRIKKRDLFQT